MMRLKQEKERDRKENVKIKKDQWERGIAYKKQMELQEKMSKLQRLTEVRREQEEVRRETVRRKQEELRRAIEERTSGSHYIVT